MGHLKDFIIVIGMAPRAVDKKNLLLGSRDALNAAISSGHSNVVEYLCNECANTTERRTADNSLHKHLHIEIFRHAVSSVVASLSSTEFVARSQGVEYCIQALLQHKHFGDHVDDLLFDSTNAVEHIPGTSDVRNATKNDASATGHTDTSIGKQALRYRTSRKMNALEFVCFHGHVQAARLLLEAGADPNGNTGALGHLILIFNALFTTRSLCIQTHPVDCIALLYGSMASHFLRID